MELRVNNTDVKPIRVRDRIEFRFDSGYDLDYVTLKGYDIFGDIQLSEIQLEQSTLATPFVEPMVSDTVASGLFKTVQGISYEITSPDSDTWAQIKQSVEGSITTYHNGPLQSTIAHTIDDIIFGIRDIVSGDQASFNLRLDGIQQVVKNEMFQSIQTQLSNFVGLELTSIEGDITTLQATSSSVLQSIGNIEGDINTIQSTAQGTIQRIEDAEGNLNTIQSTVDGTIQSISDLTGNLNTIQSTVDGTIQSISDLTGDYNTIRDTVNSHSQIIGTDGGNISQLLMNDRLFQVNVLDGISQAKSSVTVLSDSIGLRASGNQIFIGGSGITIDAKSIYLGSSTQIKDGIITNNLIASNANINGAKIANATIGDAKIANLDVSKISGNTANFVVANFNAGQYSLTLSGTGLRSSGSNYSYHLDSLGVQYYSGTTQVAVMRGYYAASGEYSGRTRGVGILAKPGYEIHLGYGTGSANTTYTPALAVDGTTGNIYMNNIYPKRDTSHGLEFISGSIGDNQGWHFRHTNSNNAGIFFANNGHTYVRRGTGTYLNLSTWSFSGI